MVPELSLQLFYNVISIIYIDFSNQLRGAYKHKLTWKQTLFGRIEIQGMFIGSPLLYENQKVIKLGDVKRFTLKKNIRIIILFKKLC